MGFRGRHVILIAFVVVVVIDIAHARMQPIDRKGSPPASGPVRVENGDVVIDARSQGRLYYANGTLRGPGASVAPQRVTIPLKQVQRLTIYEVTPTLWCEQGACYPCKPVSTCLNPPQPPPPPAIALNGLIVSGLSFHRHHRGSDRRPRP